MNNKYFASINIDNFIDIFSIEKDEICDTEFEVKSTDAPYFDETSGRIFKVINGMAVQSKSIEEFRQEQENDYKRFLLRQRREQVCFQKVNRGIVWFNTLTDTQKQELQKWYDAWLDVTLTLTEPEPIKWLK